MAENKKTTKQSSGERANVWKQRFEHRRDKQQQLFKDAQKYYDILYAVQNTEKMSPWKSKVYVPVLASKAWDLVSKMSDVVPRFDITFKGELELNPETGQFELPPAVAERKRRAESKLEKDYRRGTDEPMKLKVFNPLVDAVAAGTGYAYAPWVSTVKKTHSRKFDEDGNAINDRVITKKEHTGYNDFEPINFFNVFPAEGPSFFKIPYLIVRGRKPLVDLKAAGIYKNLDKVQSTGNDVEFEQYNMARNRVVNEQEQSHQDETVEMVTYYQCFERTEKGVCMTTYAEGRSDDGQDTPWVEIREKSYPYWHNMFPVVPFYLRKKTYSVFGESLFENNRTLQSATNDLFNHYLDNWNLSIDSMIMYEDGTLTNDFVVEPGGEIRYTGDAPKQYRFPEPNPQQLSVVMNVLDKGIENATFSQYASGVPNSQNDKTQGTAYGVKTITEAATTKIGFFRDNFKQSMKVLGEIWLSNLKQFADQPEEVMSKVNGKNVPDIILPSDYQGETELDVDDDSMVPLSKQDKREMHSQFINEVLGIQKAAMQQAQVFKQPADIPRFNFHEIFEESAELSSTKDVERFLLDSNVEIPAEQQEEDDPRAYLNFSYKDAPADVQAQIEEMYGLQPSAMHDTRIVREAYEEAKFEADLENALNAVEGDNNGRSKQNTGPAKAV